MQQQHQLALPVVLLLILFEAGPGAVLLVEAVGRAAVGAVAQQHAGLYRGKERRGVTV